MNLIPGSWRLVLIVALLVFIVFGLLCLQLQRWRRHREHLRVMHSYSRYIVAPDYRDATAFFHRLRRAHIC